MTTPYDSIIVVSFGGPNGHDDVMPFLENVTRGRNIPRERLEEVADHYHHFGGVSPINAQNLALIDALRARLEADGPALPIYYGNRNWTPFLPEALEEMARDGRKRALAFFTSLFSCYSGCRQYRENIAAAQEQVGPAAPSVEKLRMGFNHPGFIEAMADRTREALSGLPESRRDAAHLLFTAHSIPTGMARNASYELQLKESSRLVASVLGRADPELCFQSRSGPPSVPWLEPDVNDVIRTLPERAVRDVVIVPIGFVSDHLEVLYDLDTEAVSTGEEVGVTVTRAATVGTHPAFIDMIRDLIIERMEGRSERAACGDLGAWHDVCPANCCLQGATRPAATAPDRQTA